MCNLYSHTRNVEAIRKLFAGFSDAGVNMPVQPTIYPDYTAPIIRNDEGGPRLAMTRWGMPTSSDLLFKNATARADKLKAKNKPYEFKELLRMEPDGGTTNVRKTTSRHWTRWLRPENRCLVPFNAFAEPDPDSLLIEKQSRKTSVPHSRGEPPSRSEARLAIANKTGNWSNLAHARSRFAAARHNLS